MTHSCYACAPANPERVFAYDGGRAIAQFPMRFNGPPGNANGGIAVGALACPALASGDSGLRGTRITARLRRGIACDQSLTAEVTPAEGAVAVSISDGDGTLVEGTVTLSGDQRSSDVSTLIAELAPVARIGAGDRPPFFEETGDHPIPGCFSCGPYNARGLHIYPRVAGDGLTCAPWHAAAEFDDGDGMLAPMIVASALDCSSGICMPVEMQRDLLAEDAFFLLGSLDVHFLRPAPVGRDYHVVAKALRRDGRKFFGASVLFDGDAVPYATAEATWIVAGISRTEAFGTK